MPKPEAKQSTAARMAPGQRPQLQVAALCWRRSAKGLRVLLITSRDTGRWVIPKGWPMRHRSDAEAAAREAYEEAGLRGEVSSRSIGIYTYHKVLGPKQSIPVVVRVFPLEAREMLRTYPETGQRRVKWFAPDKAAQRVAEPDLAALIRSFNPEAPDGPPEAPPESAKSE
jgi:8-oxo-dGTP pyrophosphatase MutT (NUDIX family)